MILDVKRWEVQITVGIPGTIKRWKVLIQREERAERVLRGVTRDPPQCVTSTTRIPCHGPGYQLRRTRCFLASGSTDCVHSAAVSSRASYESFDTSQLGQLPTLCDDEQFEHADMQPTWTNHHDRLSNSASKYRQSYTPYGRHKGHTGSMRYSIATATRHHRA